MLVSSIIFYGSPGLEADIFQSYMRCSGYPVHVVTQWSDCPPLTTLASAFAVIALDQPAEELVRMAHELYAHSEGAFKRIFVLADGQAPPPAEPQVEMIRRPYRLTEVIRRIQFLSRQD